MASEHSLLEGKVSTVLRHQSTPMAVGVVAVILVNIIDTYWASKLGTAELAAMSFAFPVIGVLINVSIGLMIGTSVAVARIVGGGDAPHARRVAAHALLLGLTIVGFVSSIGFATHDAVFAALGASPELIPVIRRYMNIWFLSVVFLVVPMMLNGVLRGHGDAKSPRNIMILVAVVNAILDPILIFGAGPIPGLGLEGAALATALARVVGFVYALRVALRMKALVLTRPGWTELIASFRRVLSVGLPATLTNVLGPIATAMLVAIVALYGDAAVAAYGIGARVEALVLIPALALSSGLSPFVGQNWGAQLEDRVAAGFRVAVNFCIAWGLGAMAVMLVAAPWIAAVFSEDAEVRRGIITYLRIVPIGYAAYSVIMMLGSAFNAMDHPLRSTLLSVLRSILLAVPTAWLASQWLGLDGVFLGLVVGSFLSALVGLRWMRTFLSPAVPIRGERPRQMEHADFLVRHSDEEQRAAMERLLEVMRAREDVELNRIRRDAVGFFVGPRQLGHIHPSGHVDLPLPRELGEALVQAGKLAHHRHQDDTGWYTKRIEVKEDVERALWLLSLAHALYEVRKRGVDAPLVAAELADLGLAPACRDAAVLAARRWCAARHEAAGETVG